MTGIIRCDGYGSDVPQYHGDMQYNVTLMPEVFQVEYTIIGINSIFLAAGYYP